MRPTTSMTTGSPCAFFDGTGQHGICSCGVYIKIAGDQAIEIYWNAGPSSNNRAEAVALAGLLSFCNFLDISFLQIYGDSRIIIDHVLSKHNIKNIHLDGWLERIAAIWKNKKAYRISHIDKNKNKKVDALSRRGFNSPQGVWRMRIKMDNTYFQIQDFCFPGI